MLLHELRLFGVCIFKKLNLFEVGFRDSAKGVSASFYPKLPFARSFCFKILFQRTFYRKTSSFHYKNFSKKEKHLQTADSGKFAVSVFN